MKKINVDKNSNLSYRNHKSKLLSKNFDDIDFSSNSSVKKVNYHLKLSSNSLPKKITSKDNICNLMKTQIHDPKAFTINESEFDHKKLKINKLNEFRPRLRSTLRSSY